MTAIEWTDATWNPVTGCDKVSPGCDHCYAEMIALQNRGGAFPTGFAVTLHPERLDKPLHWRKPRRVFVNSMSHMFHDQIPDDFIEKVWDTMGKASQHTFQILTKRPGRMRALARRLPTLPNVWLGVSAEDQRWADIRIPILLDTTAAVRFISAEPLLGPIDLTNHLAGLDWVIAGGESGQQHRGMDPNWPRSIRDQCANAGTAFLFKQWGGRTPKSGGRELDGRTWDEYPTESRKAVSDNPYDVPGADPLELAKIFGIDINAPSPSPNGSASNGATDAREKVDPIPLAVQEALDNPVLKADGTVDQSRTTHHIAAVCAEAGLSLEQTRWVVDQDPKLAKRVAKFLARSSPRDDVQISWEQARRNAWAIPGAGSQQASGAQQRVRVAKHSGHLGWAVKLAAHEKNRLLYVNGVGWHQWDSKRFARDADGAARRAVHAMLKRARQTVLNLNLSNEEEEKRLKAIAAFETTSAITGILTEAAALKVFSVVADDLDADPWLFNCQNGTLDLRTMDLGPHDPSNRISKIANAAYDPAATGTEWTGFLAKVLPIDEVRAYLRRVTGLSLLGEVNGDKQIAPIMVGSGANGKTTYIETVCFAMGDYAMTAEPTLLMSKRGEVHPTGVADLLGKRLVSTTETQQGARFDIALLKRLTGGDTLKARWMRQDFFEFTPSHLLLMSTNHLPEVDDGSEAVWRRIRLIPFTVEIPRTERDEGLKDRLAAEADAVLSWIIGGWADYRTNGTAEPAAVLTATANYQAESDAVGRFIAEECLTGGAQSSATTSDLYVAWEKWAAKNGCLPMSMKAFGRDLDVRGYPADLSARGRRRHRICLKPIQFWNVAGP